MKIEGQREKSLEHLRASAPAWLALSSSLWLHPACRPGCPQPVLLPDYLLPSGHQALNTRPEAPLPRGRPRPAGGGEGRAVREKTPDQDWAGHSSHRQSMATMLGAGSSSKKETQTDQSLPGKEAFSPTHTQTCLAGSARPPDTVPISRSTERQGSPDRPGPGHSPRLSTDSQLGWLAAGPGSLGAPGGVSGYSRDSRGLPWASGPPVCGGPTVCSPSSSWAVLRRARGQCQE